MDSARLVFSITNVTPVRPILTYTENGTCVTDESFNLAKLLLVTNAVGAPIVRLVQCG